MSARILLQCRGLPALGLGLALLCLGQAAGAQAQLYVAVNSSSPVVQLNQRELMAIYTGRTRSLGDGKPVRPLDQPRNSREREAFYLTLTGMDLARINSYWARLLFTGQVSPPVSLEGDGALKAELKRDVHALAYLRELPASNEGLRVVMTLNINSPP